MARASTAPVAVVLLVAVTVFGAASVALVLPALPDEPEPRRTVGVDATADGWVVLTLRSGPAVDVDRLDVRVAVDDQPLRHHPPVPFFVAHGFRAGPTGPFNVASDQRWSVAETASFRVAGTNDPTLSAGASVRIRLLVNDQIVAVARTTVERADRPARRRAAVTRRPVLARP